MMIPDYKTAISVAPAALRNTFWRYGYHQQAALYLEGVRALDLGGPDTAFLFICQEKTAPHLVTVAELTPAMLAAGAELNRRAIRLYANCVEADHWPGHTGGEVALIDMPRWARYELEELPL